MDTNFYFYFPSQEATGPLAERLRSEEFNVDVRESATKGLWLLSANKDLSPEGLDELDERFESEADALGAEYDGYDRAVG